MLDNEGRFKIVDRIMRYLGQEVEAKNLGEKYYHELNRIMRNDVFKKINPDYEEVIEALIRTLEGDRK